MHSKLFSVLLLFAFVSVCFAEEWYQTYDAAKKAVGAQQWSVAETKLNDALQKNPTQGRRVFTYGLIFTVYIPDYYLGVVYYNQGKYDQALAKLKKVQSAGLVTPSDPEYAILTKLQKECTDKLAALHPAQPKPAAQNTQQAAVPQQQTAAPAAAPKIEAPPAQQSSAATLKQAEQLLGWHQYDQARKRAKDALAQGAGQEDIDRFLHKVDVQEKLEELRAAVGRNDWPEAQSISREVLSIDSNNTEAKQLQATIDQALAQTKADELINTAIVAFYSGQYQQTIDLLERALPRSESAEAHFYLGCSYAAQGFLRIAERDALLKQAKQEFLKVHQMDPAFATRNRAISPRIVTIYLQSV